MEKSHGFDGTKARPNRSPLWMVLAGLCFLFVNAQPLKWQDRRFTIDECGIRYNGGAAALGAGYDGLDARAGAAELVPVKKSRNLSRMQDAPCGKDWEKRLYRFERPEGGKGCPQNQRKGNDLGPTTFHTFADE
jgi:hypothetical protein